MSRIVLPGGSGYLGSALSRRLVDRGDDVVVLTRSKSALRDGVRLVHWDGATLGPWAQELDGADAIVHLSGKRVDCRPTRANIDALISSRVEPVRVVGQAVRECSSPPHTWVQPSTLAIYGNTGDQILHEAVVPSGIGPRQMVTVALAWETAFRWASEPIQRTVLLRPGIALGGDADPATRRLGQLVRWGLGGAVAGGRQWVSWIALEDLLEIMLRAIDDESIAGTYLATAPDPVTNADMMATYRRLLGRSFGLPAPAWITRMGAWMMGSDGALALAGRRAIPQRLQEEGFDFNATSFEDAVARAIEVAGDDE